MHFVLLDLDVFETMIIMPNVVHLAQLHGPAKQMFLDSMNHVEVWLKQNLVFDKQIQLIFSFYR
jgi:hypothetical protein